jgi:phosphate transport system substrate-binding protein
MSLTFVKKAALAAGIFTLAASASVFADSQQLTGAGSTAIYPVLSAWSDTYNKNTGIALNYQAIGSGGGIQQIENKTVNFGATDKPLKSEDLQKNNLIQFPSIFIGITPVVHLEGVKPGDLVLDGKTLADIFLGKVIKWNDPEIAALNKGVNLPDLLITVVHRSDGSGTTFTFSNYLSKVSDDWKTKVGFDTAISWPTGVGGKGNAGVAGFVNQINGAIGYVEYAYATQNNMIYTRMINADGKTVSPDLKTFSAASAHASWSTKDDFFLIITDQPGDESWPIAGATWVLMRKDADKAQNENVLKYFTWCLNKGQDQAEKLVYVPLPDSVVKLIGQYWKDELGIDTAKHRNFH